MLIAVGGSCTPARTEAAAIAPLSHTRARWVFARKNPPANSTQMDHPRPPGIALHRGVAKPRGTALVTSRCESEADGVALHLNRSVRRLRSEDRGTYDGARQRFKSAGHAFAHTRIGSGTASVPLSDPLFSGFALFRGSEVSKPALLPTPSPPRPHLPPHRHAHAHTRTNSPMSAVEASFSTAASVGSRAPTLEHGWRWGSASQLRQSHEPVGTPPRPCMRLSARIDSFLTCHQTLRPR